jgi:hypothetical protein
VLIQQRAESFASGIFVTVVSGEIETAESQRRKGKSHSAWINFVFFTERSFNSPSAIEAF